MGSVDRQPTAAVALTHKGIPAKSGPATKALVGLALLGWAGVGHTLGARVEIGWVVAAMAAAFTVTVAAIAAVVLGVLARIVAVNGWRTIEATHEHADRIVEATREHADSMEKMTKAHAQELRKQILDLNWLLTAKFRGEALAQMDLNGHDPSDTGPFPTVRSGG